MRPANLNLKAAAIAALALNAAAAIAITPAPPEVAIGPIGAASAAAPAKVLTSAAVQAVPMGRAGASPAELSKRTAIGTIAELEELQRQTALAEARKRLQELSQGSNESKPPVVSAPGSALPSQQPSLAADSQPAKVRKVKQKKSSDQASPTAFASLPMEVVQVDPVANQPPKAKLVNLMVMGGRARADVLDSGRMLTVKEGDMLSKWTVASITAEGVTVEYRYTVDVPVAPVVPPVLDAKRPAVAEAFPAAYAMVNSRRASEPQDRVKSVKLDSATQQEIAAAAGITPALGGPLPPAIPKASPAAVMAGGNGVADSTSIPPVPPLPAPLGAAAGNVPIGQR